MQTVKLLFNRSSFRPPDDPVHHSSGEREAGDQITVSTIQSARNNLYLGREAIDETHTHRHTHNFPLFPFRVLGPRRCLNENVPVSRASLLTSQLAEGGRKSGLAVVESQLTNTQTQKYTQSLS